MGGESLSGTLRVNLTATFQGLEAVLPITVQLPVTFSGGFFPAPSKPSAFYNANNTAVCTIVTDTPTVPESEIVIHCITLFGTK